MNRKSITFKKNLARQRRIKSIKKKISGTSERPRLVVFRSLKNISAQIIDDDANKILVSLSTISKDIKIDKSKKKTKQSFEIGLKLGELALKKGITQVCFDRSGYLYHGRVKALADGTRKAGIKF